jgi:hypothetical protein
VYPNRRSVRGARESASLSISWGKDYKLSCKVENLITSSMETVHFGYQNRLKPVHAIALGLNGLALRRSKTIFTGAFAPRP